jgi:hypothetical protein
METTVLRKKRVEDMSPAEALERLERRRAQSREYVRRLKERAAGSSGEDVHEAVAVVRGEVTGK